MESSKEVIPVRQASGKRKHPSGQQAEGGHMPYTRKLSPKANAARCVFQAPPPSQHSPSIINRRSHP